MLMYGSLNRRDVRHSLFYARKNRLKKLVLSNSIRPSITGTQTVGQVLTAKTGNWSGSGDISFTYQWKRSGSDIGGATSNTYTLVALDSGDTITVEVTAVDNNNLPVTFESGATGVIP